MNSYFKGNAPTFATEHAAGADLIANEKRVFAHGDSTLVGTGTWAEIPFDHFGLLTLRSSLGLRGFVMPNAPGIIDPDYRGEIKVCLMYLGEGFTVINKGDRIAQLILVKRIPTYWERDEELTVTDRGEGGFGSTGK